MSTEDVFKQISLSEASYADFEGIDVSSTAQELINALLAVEDGFSQSQAEEFVKHWRVVHHQPDTGFGFSATVFESLDHPGELSFAIRGTAGFQDLIITDASDIVLDGIALDQVVDMYNYWQRLNAGAGQFYQVARLAEASELTANLAAAYLQGKEVGDAYAATLGAQPGIIIDLPGLTVKTVVFEPSSQSDGLGLIPDDLTGINVVGHSLGGHLAMAFTRLFSEINPLAYTVNGAGFRNYFNVDNLLDALAGRDTVFDDSRILNFYGTAGLEFVTQDFFLGLQQQGLRLPLFTENTLKGTLGHGVGQMTDSAAVYDLFITLDDTLKALAPLEAINRLTPVFEAAAINKDFSIETLVNGLGTLLVSGFTPIDSTEEDDRNVIYARINGIRQAIFVDPNGPDPALKPEFLGLNVVDITGVDAIDLKSMARNSIAYRYALMHLNPFVIAGNASIYDSHNPIDENGAGPLDLESFSPQYLDDRIAMLVLGMRFAREGSNIEYLSREGSNIYRDLGTGITLTTYEDPVPGPEDPQPVIDNRYIFGTDANEGVELFNTSSSNDHVYGGGGDDVIAGQHGRDYLEGNGGDDTLYHNDDTDPLDDDGAIDFLRGGSGNDTYYAGHGDMIEDSDPENQHALIRFNGIDIRGEYALLAGNVYKNAANGLYLTLSDNDISIRNIDADNNVTYITLLNARDTGQEFNNGDYGIVLNGQPPIPGGLNLINGSDVDDDLIGTNLDDEIHGFAGADTISGEDGNDLLIGDAGADDLQGGMGNDVLRSGADDDNAVGGEGDDVIQGDDGDDMLFGGPGNDVISGGSGRDVLTSTTGDDFFAGGTGDDFISAGEQHDYLDGGDDNDVLAGGAGADTLLGGAGDDVLFGDGTYVALDRGWSVTVTDTLPDDPGGLLISFNNSIVGTATSIDDQGDLLRGGDGNDVLLGGGGNDQLFGEAGNDSLEGEEGDDRLEGGAGDDVLWGDGSTDPNLSGNDILRGGDGVDTLAGGPGSDDIDGGNGDDLIYGDQPGVSALDGDDVITGGVGNDRIFAGGGNDVVTGGRGQDQIAGELGDDFIDGGADDDLLLGNAGADMLIGGQGNDQIDGGDGDDTLIGDAGSDILIGGAGNDVIDGGAGADSIDGGSGDDEIHGGDGNDINIQGNTGADLIFGDGGNDVLFGQEGDDQLFGGSGNDQLVGGSGLDILRGDDGDDALFGGDDNDTLIGGAGLDTLQGGAGDDNLSGGDDRDLLFGENGNDSLSGDAGNDTLLGGAGDDNLSGGAGDDELQGGADGDVLNGGAGNDTLFGDAGTDTLHGGGGNDSLWGDAGDDVFRFEIGDGQDTIFEQSDTLGDILQLGAGITAADLIIEQNANDLMVSHQLNSTDQITIRDWFADAGNKLDHIKFDDGSVWTQSVIENNVNLAPMANPDSIGTDEDTPVLIQAATLLANDTDANGDPLSISAVDNAVHGTVVLDPDGDVLFTPDGDYNGTATFDYTATDGKRAVAVSSVAVTVASINDAPFANPDSATLVLKPTDITVPPNGVPVLTGGDEFLVNTTVQNRQSTPGTASLTSGGYVVVWSGNSIAGDNIGIAGQLFDQSGRKVNTEFLINTDTSFGQDKPAVAALSDGGFVVIWETTGVTSGDGSANGIAGQRFDGAGNPLGVEFKVNTLTFDNQIKPSVAGLGNGGFVVTWITSDPAGGSPSAAGISAQRYDAAGNPLGTEFLVNTTAVFLSSDPVVTGLQDGGFVIAWSGTPVDGFSDIVYQRYAANGNAVGSESIANTNTLLNQDHPGIDELPDGKFVITWNGSDPASGDSSSSGISGRLFDSAGNPIGAEFLVNTTTADTQWNARVTGLTDGGFVVAWENTNFSNISEITAQRFDADGNKVAAEFQVNAFTGGTQTNAGIAALTDGGFALVWESADPAIGDPNGSTGGSSNLGIAGRVYRFEVPVPTDNKITIDVLGNDIDVDDNILSYTLDSISLQGAQGAAAIVNNQLFYDAGADFEFLDEGDTATVTIDYTMSDDDGAGSSSTATINLVGVNDLPVVEGAIPDQIIDEDAVFSFSVPSGIYRDPDADDSLTFSAALADGNALPGWLGFDAGTLTFIGMPDNNDVGTVAVNVTATDSFGETVSTGFALTVNNVNDAPVVNAPLPDLFIQAQTPFDFILPPDTFIDVDVGDALTYSAAQENGDPLPAWLSFDPVTLRFSGTPGNTDNGIINVRVTATDSADASAFEVSAFAVNALPEPGLDAFNTLENTPITISVAGILANDSDRDNDPLTVTAVASPVGGSVNTDVNGDFIYIPAAGFNGEGGFDYTVSDGRGGNSTGHTAVNVYHPVNGDDGDNNLTGTTGYDVLNGGAGNDVLTGGAGNDIYLFGRGGGNDLIVETETATGGDVLRFNSDIAFADVMITEEGKDLVFSIKDSGDSIRLGQWKAGSSSYPINLEFGDGTALTTENLAMRQKMAGGGNPTVRGSNFSDRLYGDDRDNHIIGKSGNDIIDGGPGNDLLEGMEGDDTYQFTAGWGNDTIIENDMTSGNMDIVAFGSGLLPLDLMFNRSGDDLIVSQIGAANMITVSGWYLGATYQTEIFRASDGSVLLNSQVDRLIQDMAAFTQESGLDWVQAAQQMPEQTETILATAWNEANVMTG